MGMDILELADQLWRSDPEAPSFHPVGHLGGLAELTDSVAFAPSMANVTGIRTDEGLVLVDTGSSMVAPLIHEELRRWTDERLHSVVFTHGHIDHVMGISVWEAENEAEGWEPAIVYAHEKVPRRFDRYVLTQGYNQVVNRRQFGFDELIWPVDYHYPDETYATERSVSVGGVQLELSHEMGETDDHTMIWLPAQRVLCCGDLFIWASPNAGNPQKVQRYPREWAQALRRMAALEPDYLLPGHGLPVVGADRVRQALEETAQYLESLVAQTLALMNVGARLDEVLHAVAPPSELVDRPFLRPIYDEPEFIVRNIWRLYGGWWDGNPASVKPAPEADLARELAALAGGAAMLADRALELIESATVLADPGELEAALRLAGHLAETAWLAAPQDAGIQAVRQQVFARRAETASSTMARGIFNWAAHESEQALAAGLSQHPPPTP